MPRPRCSAVKVAMLLRVVRTSGWVRAQHPDQVGQQLPEQMLLRVVRTSGWGTVALFDRCVTPRA